MTYYFHNDRNYGDCLVSLDFLIRLAKINDIKCSFSYNEQSYIDVNQLLELIPKKSNVIIENRHSSSYDLWGFVLNQKNQALFNIERQHCAAHPQYLDVVQDWINQAQLVCKELNLLCPINTVEDTLFDSAVFKKNTLNKN